MASLAKDGGFLKEYEVSTGEMLKLRDKSRKNEDLVWSDFTQSKRESSRNKDTILTLANNYLYGKIIVKKLGKTIKILNILQK